MTAIILTGLVGVLVVVLLVGLGMKLAPRPRAAETPLPMMKALDVLQTTITALMAWKVVQVDPVAGRIFTGGVAQQIAASPAANANLWPGSPAVSDNEGGPVTPEDVSQYTTVGP